MVKRGIVAKRPLEREHTLTPREFDSIYSAWKSMTASRYIIDQLSDEEKVNGHTYY